MSQTPSADELHPGRVLASAGGVYDVRLDDGTMVQASLRGRLKLEARTGDRVVAGDRVEVLRAGDGASIESVEARSSELARRAPGRSRGAKVLVANVDRLVAVFSLTHPEPNPRLLDRFLVTAELNGLPGVIVLNKIDLPGAEASLARFRSHQRAGYPIIATSASDGTGLEELREILCDGTSVLAGPSGVGKSSLLNAIEPGLGLRIGEVSAVVGKGRHTTVTARLVPLPCGGWVADTPGLRELGLWGVKATELSDAFPEMREPAETCRFGQSCQHRTEPGCGVLEALRAGAIDTSRHESYLAMLEELVEAERSRY